MNYRREVDGLRAVAVLPVIFFHAGFGLFSGGYVGVDIFFVISGYLITSIICDEIATGRFSVLGFYERRARRILPALFLIMAASIPMAWVWLLPNDMLSFSRSIVAVALFASNFFFWRESGYFDTAAELKPLLHTWSLAVEEQFYVFFPLILVLLWRRKRSPFAAVMVIAVLSFALAQWGSAARPEATYYLLPARAWELLLGALLALRREAVPTFLPRPWGEAGSIFGIVLIAWAVFALDRNTPFPGVYALPPTIGTVLVLLCATPATLMGRMLGSRPLVGIGLISYSAYLWHQPLFAFARHRSADEPDKLLLAFLTAVALVLAYLSWKYIEMPFRNRAFLGRRQIFACSAFAIAAFAGVGLTGISSDGFSKRTNIVVAHPGDVGHIAFFNYLSRHFQPCAALAIAKESLSYEGFLRCWQSRPGTNIDIALVGDSHAEHLFPGLAEQTERNVAYYIKAAPAFSGRPDFETIFRQIEESTSIRVVILAMHWQARLENIPPGSSLENELTRTVRRLQAAGKQVYVIDDVPRFPFPPEQCKFVANGLQKPRCSMSMEIMRKDEATYLPSLRRVVKEVNGVTLISVRDAFCTQNTCSMIKNEEVMYRDANHLNVSGSRAVAAWIASQHPELGKGEAVHR